MPAAVEPWPPPPSVVWCDPRLVVRASPIEGAGLVAAAPVAAGEVVLGLGGRLVGDAELASLLAEADAGRAPYVDTITVDDDAHLVLPPGSAVHFGNHHCDPSLWLAGPYALAARRALAAGDEATLDYATVSGAADFALDCRCGAPGCRGRITADDWRDPVLQERYAGRWIPALARRIAGAPR